MLDDAELGEATAAHQYDVETALENDDKNLFPRIEAEAVEARRDVDLCFDENATASLIGLLPGQVQPWVLRRCGQGRGRTADLPLFRHGRA